MINYILETLLNIKEIDRTILSSDSKEILRIAQKSNKKKICITSPDLLGKSKTAILKLISHLNRNKIEIDYTYTRFIKDLCRILYKPHIKLVPLFNS